MRWDIWSLLRRRHLFLRWVKAFALSDDCGGSSTLKSFNFCDTPNSFFSVRISSALRCVFQPSTSVLENNICCVWLPLIVFVVPRFPIQCIAIQVGCSYRAQIGWVSFVRESKYLDMSMVAGRKTSTWHNRSVLPLWGCNWWPCFVSPMPLGRFENWPTDSHM